ncbi:MAG: dienelactone hydrolase family protein [Deltaproteobacteria bacterium]|jgi:carboxymethylenebutenolidase|nr:dienelactone hydrolase family protein [Deltaproteobacteria bacterium]
MEQEIRNLYHQYLHNRIDRREFIKKVSVLTGGALAVNTMLPLIERNCAAAAIVSSDDPRLYTDNIAYPGATGEVRAYRARPKDSTKLPGVIVIHENRGLNPHIQDVTRRIALEGFLAMAPDALSPLGGTPEDPDEGRALINKLDKLSTLNNYIAAVKYLKTHAMSTGKVGVVGFCWGGAMANQLAVNVPDLDAAVPYYGRQPATEDVSRIQAPLLLHYGGLDERINEGIPAFEAALKKEGTEYQLYIYPGAKHAFNNDTNPDRYDREAAQLAWKRTIAFLSEKLKE